MPSNSYSRMDSSGSASDGGGNAGNLSTSPNSSGIRNRTDSEGSDKQQVHVVLSSTDGSPPKVMTVDELAGFMKNMENMALAHEIAMNPEFKLVAYEPPKNTFESQIKDIIHKAFWDVLREQINSNPPCFENAIQLLAEVKEGFTHILPKNNKKSLDRVDEILDLTLIKQQAEQGTLDFRAYANFVIDMMARSCAPIRDEAVNNLTKIEDTVETFRGILETMNVMRLDMANCIISTLRSSVIANSVEYEKVKFKEFLELHQTFPHTENWLKRNRTVSGSEPTPTDQVQAQSSVQETPTTSSSQVEPKNTIVNAYIELLNWNSEIPYPEFLALDTVRLYNLQGRALRLCACASVMAVANGVPIISQNNDLKKTIANQIAIIMQQVEDEKSLKEVLPNVWLQLKTILNKELQIRNLNELNDTLSETIEKHILQLESKDSPIRALMWKRLIIYIKFNMQSKITIPPPPGYTDYTEELDNLSSTFKHIVTYNYSVCGEHYQDLLSKINTNIN